MFKEELGTGQSVEVKLHLKPNARPKFLKCYSIPFSLQPSIDQELQRLESIGIIQKVSTSNWAALIAPMQKKDGRIRLCGDYKLTINPELDIERYPLPKPQKLFATLVGGKKFTKLDLR